MMEARLVVFKSVANRYLHGSAKRIKLSESSLRSAGNHSLTRSEAK